MTWHPADWQALDGFDACPEPTCPLYGRAVMADHPHLDTPAAAKRRAREKATRHAPRSDAEAATPDAKRRSVAPGGEA